MAAVVENREMLAVTTMDGDNRVTSQRQVVALNGKRRILLSEDLILIIGALQYNLVVSPSSQDRIVGRLLDEELMPPPTRGAGNESEHTHTLCKGLGVGSQAGVREIHSSQPFTTYRYGT
jgi:hypothetical protein